MYVGNLYAMWEISTLVFTKSVYVLEMLKLPGKNDSIYRRQIFTLRDQNLIKRKRREKNIFRLFAATVKLQPLTNRARGPYWGILARGHDSTDRASRGPYKNDRGPIFPSTARAS